MNYNNIGKKYIKLKRGEKLKKVFTFILFFLIFIFVFFRWTGFISNTPLSWKKPEISVITNSNVNPVEQKNDQLWVNLNYNKNHSNIKNAIIYVDNSNNSQELLEGNNTYIFKNLESGEHNITYELEWSLFGKTSESCTYTMYNVSTISYNYDSDITRNETNMNIQIKQSGEFVKYNDVSTAGLYYINYDGFKTLRNSITSMHNFLNLPRSIINDFIENQNVLIKQATLMEGLNDLTFDSIIVNKDGDREILKENTDKKYTLVPMGLVNFDERIYLVISFPFYAYTFGVPFINNFTSNGNENGDIFVGNLSWNSNNYDKSGDSYVQINLYSDDDVNPIFKQLVELNDFVKNGFNFSRVLKNEEYFTTPSNLLEPIHWRIEIQIKYGYVNEFPSVDEDAPKMSNLYSKNFWYTSPSIENSIDYYFSYEPPKYIYDTNETNNVISANILWSTASWIDTPYKNSRISLETKVTKSGIDSNWENYIPIQNVNYNKLAWDNAIPQTTFKNGDELNGYVINLNEDTIGLRLRVETPIYDWWNQQVGYDIKYINLPNIEINN